MGQSVKGKYTLKHLRTWKQQESHKSCNAFGSYQFIMRSIFRESIGMQIRNKQITHNG